MTIARQDAMLTERRIVVLFGAEFLAMLATVKADGPLRVERHGGKAMVALPAITLCPPSAFADGARVNISLDIVEGCAIFPRGIQRYTEEADT